MTLTDQDNVLVKERDGELYAEYGTRDPNLNPSEPKLNL